jgi:hypothetical protein
MSNTTKDPENRNSHKRLIQDDVEIKNAAYNKGAIIGMFFVVVLIAIMILIYSGNTEAPVTPVPAQQTQAVPATPAATPPSAAATTQATQAPANPNATPADTTNQSPAATNETPAPAPSPAP